MCAFFVQRLWGIQSIQWSLSHLDCNRWAFCIPRTWLPVFSPEIALLHLYWTDIWSALLAWCYVSCNPFPWTIWHKTSTSCLNCCLLNILLLICFVPKPRKVRWQWTKYIFCGSCYCCAVWCNWRRYNSSGVDNQMLLSHLHHCLGRCGRWKFLYWQQRYIIQLVILLKETKASYWSQHFSQKWISHFDTIIHAGICDFEALQGVEDQSRRQTKNNKWSRCCKCKQQQASEVKQSLQGGFFSWSLLVWVS